MSVNKLIKKKIQTHIFKIKRPKGIKSGHLRDYIFSSVEINIIYTARRKGEGKERREAWQEEGERKREGERGEGTMKGVEGGSGMCTPH